MDEELILQRTLTLTGKTKRKGKPRIAQHGSQWRVLKVMESVHFSNKRGPWLLIEPPNKNDLRWIHATDDEHFSIEKESGIRTKD